MNRLREDEYNGLYQYSKFLGQSIADLSQDFFELNFYLPENNFGIFGDHVKYVPHVSHNKFYMRHTKQFDVWHITNQISWYRPFNKTTKVVFTIHDLNYLIEEKQNIRRNKRLLKEIQHRINRSHHLTAISEFAKQQVLQNLDVGDRPFDVIHNGCTVNEYAGFDSPAYRPHKPFLFSIGTIQKRKNFHVLPALLKDNDYELVIAGLPNSTYVDKVIAVAKQLNVLARVKLIGGITDAAKYWYYKNCKAFCFPSFAEGFGLPVVEAMYFGKPIFLSTETCLPEIGGDAAYYFKNFEPQSMRDTFVNGMHHYETTKPIEKIKQRSELFSWDDAAKQYMDIYKSLV
jgi:glycosyltransferase involved in cell wall biosynthesis